MYIGYFFFNRTFAVILNYVLLSAGPMRCLEFSIIFHENHMSP